MAPEDMAMDLRDHVRGLEESAAALQRAEREVRAAREYLRASLMRRNEARAARAAAVVACRSAGMTWKSISLPLGVSIPRTRAIHQAALAGRTDEDEPDG